MHTCGRAWTCCVCKSFASSSMNSASSTELRAARPFSVSKRCSSFALLPSRSSILSPSSLVPHPSSTPSSHPPPGLAGRGGKMEERWRHCAHCTPTSLHFFFFLLLRVVHDVTCLSLSCSCGFFLLRPRISPLPAFPRRSLPHPPPLLAHPLSTHPGSFLAFLRLLCPHILLSLAITCSRQQTEESLTVGKFCFCRCGLLCSKIASCRKKNKNEAERNAALLLTILIFRLRPVGVVLISPFADPHPRIEHPPSQEQNVSHVSPRTPQRHRCHP